jgi:wobble nucleotide-excising tRNase
MDQFESALKGFHGSKQKFMEKCIDVHSAGNGMDCPRLDEIQSLYDTMYGNGEEHPLYAMLDIDQLDEIEKCDLLGKIIMGSSDTPIGKFIQRLDNSDWVKDGINHMNGAAGKCPFCQQTISEGIKRDIESFFDAAYKEDCKRLSQFQSGYIKYTTEQISKIESITTKPISLFGNGSDHRLTDLDSRLNEFRAAIKNNTDAINSKIRSPSKTYDIVSINPLIKDINGLIDDINDSIRQNNVTVNNKKAECIRCEEMLWRYIVHELRDEIEEYTAFTTKNKSEKSDLLQSKSGKEKECEDCRALISDEEKRLTSVASTVTEINNMLKQFGFDGFKLEENRGIPGTYVIIRHDGKDAKQTLSEGEYNFITFLYFYYLIKGSHKDTGIVRDKIVVIDDPVSSLDTNTFFIVSILVKKLSDRKHNPNIKQIFILTHNLYFYKEVSEYRRMNQKGDKKDKAYFRFKKKDNVSEIEYYEENPFHTAYELLWKEVRDYKKQDQMVTLFNTLRRIIEYYFKIIGGIDDKELLSKFEGSSLIACEELIACLHEQSHWTDDCLEKCPDPDKMDEYVETFKNIFDKMGHISHYNMMMKGNGGELELDPDG